MMRKDKTTLKGYFITGATPTQQNFTELIDSLMPESQTTVICEVGADQYENGRNLIAAYNAAKTLLPGGQAPSALNRVTVILPPGFYHMGDFPVDPLQWNPLVLDTECIDIVGMTNIPSAQVILGTPPPLNAGVIRQTANDVHICNVQIRMNGNTAAEEWDWNYDQTDSAAYFPDSNLPLTQLINCEFYGNSWQDGGFGFAMRWAIEYSGKYENVRGLLFSSDYTELFGYGSVTSGTFNNVQASNLSNEGVGTGVFINCVFGYYALSGTFSGTCKYCIFGDNSINNIIAGELLFCHLTVNAFPTLSVGGKLRACIDNTGFIAERDYVAP